MGATTVIKNILRNLYYFIKPIPSSPSNQETSLPSYEHPKAFWDKYVKWHEQNVDTLPIEDTISSKQKRKSYIKYLGDEWGRKSDVEKIVSEYIYPFITKESIIAEIGSGGGRITSKVVNRCKELYCFDISSEMLKKAEAALANYSNVNYILLNQSQFPDSFTEKIDFVYSFDVFVHLDLHTMWKYFNEIRRILKEGCMAFLHTTNLKAPDGWERFSHQTAYSLEGHYFVSPEIIDILAHHSNLRIIKASTPEPTNFYLNRDYLFILEK